MIRGIAGLSMLALIVPFAPALAGASGGWQESVTLDPKLPAPGDKAEIDVRSAVELTTIITDAAKQQEPPRDSSYARAESFAQEAVGKAGSQERSLKIKCRTSRIERSATNAPPQVDKTDLDGRTFMVVWTAGSRVVKNEDGTPAGPEADSIGGWEDYGRLLPKTPVKAGDTWTVAAGDIGSLLNVGTLADARTTLTGKVAGLEGGRATLSFSGSFSGRTLEGFDLKLALEACEMDFDVTKGRPGSFSLRGSLSASKRVMKGFIPAGGSMEKKEEIGQVQVQSKKFEVSVTYR